MVGVPVLGPRLTPPGGPGGVSPPTSTRPLEEAFDSRYVNDVLYLTIPDANALPDTFDVAQLRENLALELRNAGIADLTWGVNNIKVLKVCTATRRLSLINRASDPPPRDEPVACKGVDGSDASWFQHIDQDGVRLEVHFMIVDTPPFAADLPTKYQISTRFAHFLDNAIAENGAIGNLNVTTSARVLQPYDPRSIVHSPAPADPGTPGERRGSFSVGIWLLILFGVCLCCVITGMVLSNAAVNTAGFIEESSSISSETMEDVEMEDRGYFESEDYPPEDVSEGGGTVHQSP